MQTPISKVLECKELTVISVPPHVSVLEAVRVMNRHGIGSILVMEEGMLVGIFTERDVLTRVVVKELVPSTEPVSNVMTRNPLTTTMEATVQQAMQIFHEKRCRHLPVMRGAEVLGMISIRDISRWLSEAHRAEAEHLRQYITGGY